MAGLIPDNREQLLTRVACAAALTEAGFPTSSETLATKASRGGGPPYHKFGPRALYRWGSSLDWACSKLGPPVRTTSELDIASQHNLIVADRVPNIRDPIPLYQHSTAMVNVVNHAEQAAKQGAAGFSTTTAPEEDATKAGSVGGGEAGGTARRRQRRSAL